MVNLERYHVMIEKDILEKLKGRTLQEMHISVTMQ